MGGRGEHEASCPVGAQLSHSPTLPLAHSPTRIALCALALLIHASATYRDYFRTWGRSQATFDAFEGDMAAAATWLRNNAPTGHVYLSSDIYRHPTFMLLGEQATVQTYFQHSRSEPELVRCAVGAAAAAARPARDLPARLRRADGGPGHRDPGS